MRTGMTHRTVRRMRRVAIGACVLALPARCRAAQDAPTFTKDVAPIFQEKCEACHRPDSIAPMSLVTYAETRPWARAIRARVADHTMPPWDIDRTVGVQKFKNDRSLSDKEIDTIVKWVDAGAPQGDPKDMPAARTWPEDQGWNFAKTFGQKEPDMIIKSYPFTMPAQSQDAWDKRVTPSGITEPRWVRAIEIRPITVKGRKITHHAIAYLEQEDPSAPPSGGLPDAVHGMGGRQAGRDDAPRHRQAAAARLEVPCGTSTTRRPVRRSPARSRWGSTSTRRARSRSSARRCTLTPAALGTMDIRPNTVSMAEGFMVLRDNARIESFQPHMHLRGKAMMVEAILPTGQRQVISLVSNFNFNWMTTYVYADDAAPLLPKGTILKVTAWHDNTTAKKTNPDPNQWVGWGDRTVDEMAHAWINIVYMKDEDFKVEQEKRKGTQTSTAAEQPQQ